MPAETELRGVTAMGDRWELVKAGVASGFAGVMLGALGCLPIMVGLHLWISIPVALVCGCLSTLAVKPLRRIERGLPAIVRCDNPEVGTSSHAVAVVATAGGRWKVINYRTEGPTVEWLVPRPTIAAPQALPYRIRGYGLLVPLDREAFGDRIYLQEPWYKVVPR